MNNLWCTHAHVWSSSVVTAGAGVTPGHGHTQASWYADYPARYCVVPARSSPPASLKIDYVEEAEEHVPCRNNRTHLQMNSTCALPRRRLPRANKSAVVIHAVYADIMCVRRPPSRCLNTLACTSRQPRLWEPFPILERQESALGALAKSASLSAAVYISANVFQSCTSSSASGRRRLSILEWQLGSFSLFDCRP